jgi:peroxisomal membrane protein 2
MRLTRIKFIHCLVTRVALSFPVMSKTLAKYSASLTERPLLTKAATSGTLYALQELIASAVTGSQADSSKALKMTLYGFFVSGPLGHYLFSAMEKVFEAQEGPKVGILKLLFSNLLITPITNASYLFALATFAGANSSKAIQIVKARLLGLMKVLYKSYIQISWIISPLAQTFAFRNLEPKVFYNPKLQFFVPFFNVVSFVFGTLINIQAKLENKKKKNKK